MKKLTLALLTMATLSFSATPTITEALQPEGKLNPWRFQAGAMALGALDTDNLFLGSGIMASAMRRAGDNSPVFIGLESGLIDSGDVNSTPEANVRTIPVLATTILRDDSGSFHWYGGLAIGPLIQTMTVRTLKTGETTRLSQVDLMAIFKGGADIDLTDTAAINLELLRFGLFQEAFAYMPALSFSASF